MGGNKLSEAVIKQRLQGYFNYKHLYHRMKQRRDTAQAKVKELQQTIAGLRDKNRDLKEQNKDLKKKLAKMAESKQAKKPRFRENYSLSEQEKEQDKPNKKSPGRTPKESKPSPDREEHIYPDGIPHHKCTLAYTRYVIHVKDGQKEIVLYHLYKEKWTNNIAQLPQALPRGEFGLEVALILAFLVYLVEVSIDQARTIIHFFSGVDLSRSQADALLNQLSSVWEQEMETIATILTVALLVHIDETGWKVGQKNCYAWIFTNLTHTLFLYGQDRSEQTLNQILERSFGGVVITDFYSTYGNYFKHQQKCWAHILRDAIKLMLLHPDKPEYQQFFEKMHSIFRAAKQVQKDDLTDQQLQRKIVGLQRRVTNACPRYQERLSKDTPDDVRKFVNLQKRLIRYQNSLFTFVSHSDVSPTNNRAEQGLRKTAKARNNYQTSKTDRGARRRSVITTVMTSLQQNLSGCSLDTMVEEVTKWRLEGISLFDQQLAVVRGSP
jgi:regulator of replication initiation timing